MLAIALLVIILAATRSWFMDQPWPVAWSAALGAGLVGGITCGGLIRARLAFHATDGPFAADALRSVTRLRYVATWHGICIVILAAISVIARAPLLMPGYVVAGLAVHGASGIATRHLPIRQTAMGRWARSWLRHPLAGGAAAMVLIVSLAMLSWSPPDGVMVVIAGIETAILVLALTTIDDRLVRFMAIAGHGSWGTIARNARGTALFLGLAVPACFILSDRCSDRLSPRLAQRAWC